MSVSTPVTLWCLTHKVAADLGAAHCRDYRKAEPDALDGWWSIDRTECRLVPLYEAP